MCDHSNREEAMVVIAVSAEGKPTVWCDPCLAELVCALNAAGIRTVASCCGHGYRPGVICLADGRELIVCKGYEETRALERLWPVNNCGEPID